jgi:hypothetical protein
MPRQIFDVEQYELRGALPQTYTEGQKTTLNKVVSRVNGQLDWTAQLLGFNGPRYWGNSTTDQEGNYQFVGLPQTVAEKRALQAGAFGVYNKDKPYESWPAPFNRKAVGASADLTFSVEDRDGQVAVWPFTQSRDFTFEKSPYLVVGGAYTFDQLVDVSVFNADPDTVEVIQDIDQRITRVRVLSDDVQFIAVFLEGSDAKPFTFTTRRWSDPSDWDDEDVREQFLGAWGNKGNQLSMHFAFDALDLHGFNEVEGLSLEKVTGALRIEQLLGLIGLKPGPMSALVSAPYSFEVEGCEVEGPFSPSVDFESTSATIATNDFLDIASEDGRVIATDEGSCGVQDYIFMLTDGNDGEGDAPDFDNGFFPDEGLVACFTDNGTLELPGSVTGTMDNSVYELTGDFPIEANGIYDINPLSICQDDPDSTPTSTLSNGEYPGDYYPHPGGSVDNDGTYDISIEQLMTEDLRFLSANDESFDYSGCYTAPAEEYGVCDTCDYTLTLRQVYDADPNGIATDPGPETSTPIGLNGFMRDFPIDCGIDNGDLTDLIITNFYLDRARTVQWEDITPLDFFTVETRSNGSFTIAAVGGFFEFRARDRFVSIAPPGGDNGTGLVDDGSYGDTNPNALTRYNLELPDQALFNGRNDLGLLGNQTTCYTDGGLFEDPFWFVTGVLNDGEYNGPSFATGTEDNGFFDQEPGSICPPPEPPFGQSYDWGVVYQVPFNGVVDQQEADYVIYDGIYDQDPALNCDEPQAPEVDINFFDLVTDVFGEPGPILVSDSGVGNEIVLTASDDDELGYDGFTIAFDGLELAELAFDYEAKTPFAMTEFPSVEWVVDMQLDNGTFYPVSDQGAWMGTDDGLFEDRNEYIRVGTIASIFDSEQEAIGLEFKGGLLTFDDGEFDQLVEPNCDFEGGSPCALVDGGQYVEGSDPSVPDTNCLEECGTIDSGEYRFFGYVPPASPVIDGQGSRTIPDSCTLYNNGEFDRVPRPEQGGGGYYGCTTYDNAVYPFTGIYDCRLEEWGEFDQVSGGPFVDQGEYTETLFPSTCAPCGPVPDGFDCYLNNGTFENPAAGDAADEGFYDNAFEICEPCITEVEPTVPCYVPPVRIRLDRVIYASPTWKFNPSVMNSVTPLRVWKNHVLEVADDASEELTSANAKEFLDSKMYRNALVADENTGAESEDSYRYFVRLPAEYSRNSRQWNKAANVASSYGYFSSVYPLADTAVKPYSVRPYLYDDVYCQCAADLPDYAVFYQEDYLVSSVKQARINAQAGFADSRIEFEDAAEVFPFQAGLVTEYDAYDEREISGTSGEWAGTYFKWQRRGPLTGYLITDVIDHKLRAVEYREQPEGDYSFIKAPNTEFPDDTDVANFSNYVVSYAYFTADLSAADEPVFDPTSKYGWRECNIPKCDDGTPVFVTDITNVEIVTEDGFSIGIGGQPVYVESAVESNTAYLLNRCEKFEAPEVNVQAIIEQPFTGGSPNRQPPPAQPTSPPTVTIDRVAADEITGPVTLTGTVANAGSVELFIGNTVRAQITGGTWSYTMTNADFNAMLALAKGDPARFMITATATSPTDARNAIARYSVVVKQPAAQADFFVITYGFTNGSDLDTRTGFYEPTIPGYVGWGQNSGIAQLQWGGDNTGTGVESVLFDREAFAAANPGRTSVSIDLRAMWYGSVGTDPVTITVTSYKGGQMVKSGFTWTNPTAEAAYTNFTSTEKVINLFSRQAANIGQRIAIIDLDYIAGTVNYRES